MDRAVEGRPEDCRRMSQLFNRISSPNGSVALLQRQFQRLVEMLILLRLDPSDSRAVKAYRLQVKERLYRFNYVMDSPSLMDGL
jgi:hypothetical protein